MRCEPGDQLAAIKPKRGFGIDFSEGMVKEAYALSSRDFWGYTA